MKNTLLVGDLHLAEGARNEYRFRVFDQIEKFCEKTPVARIILLGDLCDAKDRHTGALVNRIVASIAHLVDHAPVFLLAGNHDAVDASTPFFSFLDYLPGVTYYSSPAIISLAGKTCAVLPHSRRPHEDWKHLDLSRASYAFAHITLSGAIGENGQPLASSITSGFFAIEDLRTYSGDVHVPQKVGKVTYVGSPHPVHFGDAFKPRLLYLDDKERERSIPLEGVQRVMLDISTPREIERAAVHEGDQVKVRLHLEETDVGRWHALRKKIVSLCAQRKLDLVQVLLVRRPGKAAKKTKGAVHFDPVDTLEAYCEQRDLPSEYRKQGVAALRRALADGKTAPTAGARGRRAARGADET